MPKITKVSNRRQAPGLEWIILKKIPKLMLAATAVPLLMSLIGRLLPLDSDVHNVSKQISTIDIFSIAIGVTAWTALFTVAIGCVVVVIMKGPRYKADSYEMNESEDPKSDENNGL